MSECVSNEELEASLRELTDDLGRTPQAIDVMEFSPYDHVIYLERYGGHFEALTAAGIELDEVQQRVIKMREGNEFK